VATWIAAAMVLNAALVAAVIVLAVRIGGRNVPIAFTAGRPSPAPALARGERLRPAPFSPGQMNRAEWHALLDAYRVAHDTYLQKLADWHVQRPRAYGALSRAKHELEVAKRRLDRFERTMVATAPLRLPHCANQ